MAHDESFKDDYTKKTELHGDIRNGSAYIAAAQDVRRLNRNGCLIGVMLAIDDTPLTQHSGTHNGRPVYMSTCNQSLQSRRKRVTSAWRILALLPVLSLGEEENLSTIDKNWSVHAKVEFNQRVLSEILKPIAGNHGRFIEVAH